VELIGELIGVGVKLNSPLCNSVKFSSKLNFTRLGANPSGLFVLCFCCIRQKLPARQFNYRFALLRKGDTPRALSRFAQAQAQNGYGTARPAWRSVPASWLMVDEVNCEQS